jgi:hypothetical protein
MDMQYVSKRSQDQIGSCRNSNSVVKWVQFSQENSSVTHQSAARQLKALLSNALLGKRSHLCLGERWR